MMKQMSLQRLYRDIQYSNWTKEQFDAAEKGDKVNVPKVLPKVVFSNNACWTHFRNNAVFTWKLVLSVACNFLIFSPCCSIFLLQLSNQTHHFTDFSHSRLVHPYTKDISYNNQRDCSLGKLLFTDTSAYNDDSSLQH